jgi:rubrerythrin
VVDIEWECMDCGYLFEGEKAPLKCPDCGATDSWEKTEYVDEWDQEDEDEQEEFAEPDWECLECGYGFVGNRPPTKCPDCAATDSWAKVEYVDEWDEEEADEQGEPVEPDWECLKCGHGLEGDTPPPQCPDCGAANAWARVEYIDWVEEDADKGEEPAEPDWECLECGYGFAGHHPPPQCPGCGGVDLWSKVEYIDAESDEEEGPEEQGGGGEESAPEGWECVECGYFFEGKRPANSCPDCGAVDAWVEAAYLDTLPSDNADADR